MRRLLPWLALALAAVAGLALWLSRDRGAPISADGRCFADCVLREHAAEDPLPADLRAACARACEVDPDRLKREASEREARARR